MTAPARQSLAELRVDVAATRAAVRAAERSLEHERARAEQDAIDAKGGDPKALGPNKEDRERALVLLIEQDPLYVAARAQCEQLTAHLDRLTAQVEIARDERREREISAQEQLADALASCGGLSALLDPRERQRS